MREKEMQPQHPTQNLQMMRDEPREEDPNVNIVLRSGITIGEDKGKHPEESEWVCKALKKEVGFNIEHVKETVIEVKKSFAEASISRGQDKQSEEMEPSMLTTFLETCMKLLRNIKAMKGLQEFINKCQGKENAPKGPCMVRKISRHKKITGHEVRLTTQIGEYEMDHVILDLGSDANVFPKHTWEIMGRPTQQWSPIQLRMVNQQKVIPMERLQGVTIDIEGVSALADFEVIGIIVDSNPYPTLLGIDQAINMNGVINLKKRMMSFERNSLCVVVPLHPTEGPHYAEPIYDYESDDDLDQIYKIMARDKYWVNLKTDGCIAWDRESSCT